MTNSYESDVTKFGQMVKGTALAGLIERYVKITPDQYEMPKRPIKAGEKPIGEMNDNEKILFTLRQQLEKEFDDGVKKANEQMPKVISIDDRMMFQSEVINKLEVKNSAMDLVNDLLWLCIRDRLYKKIGDNAIIGWGYKILTTPSAPTSFANAKILVLGKHFRELIEEAVNEMKQEDLANNIPPGIRPS